MRLRSVGLVCVSLVLAGCNAQGEVRREAPPRPVLVAEIHYAPRVADRVLPGVVKARVESDLGFRIAGKIAHRFVDAGAVVKKGQKLAELDDSDLKLQEEQAQADLAAAKSAREQQDADLARVETLHRQGWSATADLDKIRAAADQSRANLIKAERAATLAGDALSYATLTADADGIVTATLAEPGQVVAAGAPVIRLAHSGEKEASVAIPEALVERAKSAPAEAEFWALPGLKLQAHLRELSPNADPTTRTYEARYSLIAAPDSVALGMSASVKLALAAEKVARAPLGAILDQGQGPMVWIVDEASGAIRPAKVQVVAYDGESALIAGGAPEGALIVALGAHKLDPSQKVRVVRHIAGL
ncbi:MAG TPA: efflux RND transporter periplasmic adaptor subunit [Roseiarcus sp.]|nr:efflux RND transporter periplasmic adaptor subunit [Roseiarcus sp.]